MAGKRIMSKVLTFSFEIFSSEIQVFGKRRDKGCQSGHNQRAFVGGGLDPVHGDRGPGHDGAAAAHDAARVAAAGLPRQNGQLSQPDCFCPQPSKV